MKLDILGTASQLFHGIVVMACRALAITAALVVAPVVFFALPLYLIFQNPNGDYGWLGATLFFAAPWSCAFYMALLASWGWRSRCDSYIHAVGKAFALMIGGLVGSYLLEGVYMVVAMHFFPVLQSAVAHAIAFESLLVTAFIPVIVLLIKRRGCAEPATV